MLNTVTNTHTVSVNLEPDDFSDLQSCTMITDPPLEFEPTAISYKFR